MSLQQGILAALAMKLTPTRLSAFLGLFPAMLSHAGGGHDHDHGPGLPGLYSAYTTGHGDIGAAFHGGELELHLHLHEGALVNGVPLAEDAEPDSDSTLIVIGDKAKQTAGPSLSAGTGVPVGQSLWILPAAETAGLPRLGFGTEELNPADWTGDITFEVHEVESPSSTGHFSIYKSDGLGGFEFLASTADGGLDDADSFTLTAGGHDHFFIAFSEPGLWTVEFVAKGTHNTLGALESEHVPFLFHVGPSEWSAGHGDIGLAYENEELELHMHLHEGAVLNDATMEADTEHHADDIIIKVGREAIQLAGAGIATGTGVAEGAPVWILPTSPNPHLPFVGFGTEELEPTDWVSDLEFKLISVTSPSGSGHFSVYRPDGLGGSEFPMSTAQGGLTGDDRLFLPAGNHDHFFMAFSESGIWKITLQAQGEHSVDGTVVGEPVELTFEVAPNQGGVIKLAQTSFTANQGADSIPVTLVREYGTEAATVAIEAENGTPLNVPPFSAGLVGRDYPVSLQEFDVSFASGQMSKIVSLPLIQRAGNIPNIRFTIHLHNIAPGTEIGEHDEAEIRVLGADTTPPGLVISTPSATTTSVSATSPYTVRGTVGDARGVDRVVVVLNGGPPTEATLGSATNTMSIPWSLAINPVAGPNTLEVRAFDLRGNERTLTRSFSFVQRYTISVQRSSSVIAPLDQVGLVGFAAMPMTAASTPMPLVPHASSRPYSVVPGTSVRLTATPRPGFLFSHWNVSPAGALVSGSDMTLTMPAEDIGAAAVFVPNPVLPVAGQGNTFHGVLRPDPMTDAGNDTVGFIIGTLVPASGLFSGRVLMNGTSQVFVATFFGNGSALFTVAGARVPSLAFDGGARSLTLSLDGSGGILAQVTAGSKTSSGTLARAKHSASSGLPSTLLNDRFPLAAAANNRAFLTVALPAKTQTPPMALSSYPQGDGYGTLVISSLGVATFAATLADGSSFTASSSVVVGDRIPFLAQLSVPVGSLSGALALDTSAADSDVTASDLLWFRPAVVQLPGATGAAQATQRYTAGWPQGIKVDAVGALYNRNQDVQTSLSLPAAHASDGNGVIQLSEGKLVSAVEISRFNVVGNVVTKIPATNASFSLTLVPSTGSFSGVFTPKWTSRSSDLPVFRGVILQKGLSRGGYGWFLSNRLNDLDPESGRVTFGVR
jgi:hypothetical protein